MKAYPAWTPEAVPRLPLNCWTILLVAAAVLLSGCSIRKRPTIPWATAVQVRPVVQAHLAREVSEDSIPEFQLELPLFPTQLMTMRPVPPRPHVSVPPAGSAGKDPEKLDAPVISFQLSPQEAAVAQQETNQSLAIAEKNLASAQQAKLNAAQLDLASKIRAFIKDAREAAQMNDWSRARNLAKKAEVLSEELGRSL